MDILFFLLAMVGVYVAYRIIRGGFDRPQSERWNAYGIGLWVVIAIWALSYFFDR